MPSAGLHDDYTNCPIWENCVICLFKYDSNVHKKIHVVKLTQEVREQLQQCLDHCNILLDGLTCGMSLKQFKNVEELI